LTVGHTAYAPVPNTSPLQYIQPDYTANLLSQFLKANRPLLSTLKLTSKPNFTFPIAQGTTLAMLAETGSQDPDRAWPIFEHIWKELQAPGRPPILYCIDNVSHIMGDSKYTALNAEEKLRPIHAHDFAQVKHFIDHLSGEKELANGGMVLAATSLSEHIKSAALDVAIKAAEARQENEGETRVSKFYDPYQKIDLRALTTLTADFTTLSPTSSSSAIPGAAAANTTLETTASSEPSTDAETTKTTAVSTQIGPNVLGVIRLKGISKLEAKSILEYWATSGMVRRQIEEKFVADQWTVSGGGVLREMEKGCLRRAA
jgi:small subunit ribosomal protein S29